MEYERRLIAAGLDAERATAWVQLRARAEALNGADGDAAWRARLDRMATLLEA